MTNEMEIGHVAVLLPELPEAKENIETPSTNFFADSKLIELGRTAWSKNEKIQSDLIQPYLRGCKWSPDGTCCLCVVNNDGQHLIDLPHDLYDGDVNGERAMSILKSSIHVKESGLVYDFCWFPLMDSSFLDTCCWLSTRQHAPIQMWDAYDGSLRCSYRGFNAVDEMEPALSLAFAQNGYKIYGGYKKDVKIFDTDRPGREFEKCPIKSPASCLLALSNMLVVGSWNTSISLYALNDLGKLKSLGKMHGHTGGVTHIVSSSDERRIISGARKDSKLNIWDLRFQKKPLKTLQRPVKTNQRIYFDLSPDGKYLISGASDDYLRVWDLSSIENSDNDAPTFMFPLHKDSCNSVSFHPIRPVIATGSGQFHHSVDPTSDHDVSPTTDVRIHFSQSTPKANQVDESSDSDFDKSEGTTTKQQRNNYVRDVHTDNNIENSLNFWWIGEVR